MTSLPIGGRGQQEPGGVASKFSASLPPVGTAAGGLRPELQQPRLPRVRPQPTRRGQEPFLHLSVPLVISLSPGAALRRHCPKGRGKQNHHHFAEGKSSCMAKVAHPEPAELAELGQACVCWFPPPTCSTGALGQEAKNRTEQNRMRNL